LSDDASISDLVRGVHRRYPTGVTVVTVADNEGKPHGLAVNAFSSVSLEPPLVLVAVNATSATYPWLFATDYIAVNIVAQSQPEVVATFAKSGGDKFAGIGWKPGVTGSPVLTGTTGHFELKVTHRVTAYTHTLFIGEVVSVAYSDTPAMIYLGGKLFFSGDLTPAI